MAELHPAASHHQPTFITAPGETDVLMVVMGVILIAAVVGFGVLFLRLHTLPERIAHKSHKLQFEIVAVLGLIALFTHMHIFWIAGLLLAMIDLPDFGTSLSRIAGSTEKIAGITSDAGAPEARLAAADTQQAQESAHAPPATDADVRQGDRADALPTRPAIAPTKPKEPVHA